MECKPLALNPKQILLQQSLADIEDRYWGITRWLVDNFQWVLEDLFQATLDAACSADLIINSGTSFAGWHVAEKLNLPALAAYLWPVTPTREMPAVNGLQLPSWLPLRGFYNRVSSKLFNQSFFYLLLPLVNRCRKEVLSLPPLTMRDYWSLDSPTTPTVMLYGFSSQVIPKPADWTDYQQITGYWFLSAAESYQPAPALEDFLAAGPPPVYIGFGSMVDHDREIIEMICLDALDQAGERGLLLGGWSDLGGGDLPENVFKADSVPHDWLFPQMAAVVHHGGAGTTAAGLRAGVPSLVIPNFADQFFWGQRVFQLGAGPSPIPRKKLTVDNLADAIHQAVDDVSIHNQSARVGEAIRSEDGVRTAADLIEHFSLKGSLKN